MVDSIILHHIFKIAGHSALAGGSLSSQRQPRSCYGPYGGECGYSSLARGSLSSQGGPWGCYEGGCGNSLFYTGT